MDVRQLKKGKIYLIVNSFVNNFKSYIVTYLGKEKTDRTFVMLGDDGYEYYFQVSIELNQRFKFKSTATRDYKVAYDKTQVEDYVIEFDQNRDMIVHDISQI
jgi:hypothetical protein